MARKRIEEDFNRKKLEIIQSAFDILLEEGPERLSVNYLLRKTNMSKGAFFHYFDSKEELLSGVFDYVSKPIIDNIEAIMQKEGLNVVNKLTMLYQSVGSMKADYGKGFEALSRILYRHDNKLFLIEMIERTLKAYLPVFEELILEGIKSGDFRVESPHAAAYHILTITIGINNEIGKYFLSDRSRDKREKLKSKITLGESIIRSILNCNGIGRLYQLEALKGIGIL